MKAKTAIFGAIGSLALLGVYFLISTLVSGIAFSISQFEKYWIYFIFLSAGFGIQIGLYTLIRERVERSGVRMVAATGGTSAVAMVSCCSHYLVNLLPLLFTTAFVSLIAQYQIQIFWVAIVFNLFGILIMLRRFSRIK